MEITIYRSDYRDHADDGESLFIGVLESLNIDPSKWDDIDEVTLDVDSFKIN